MATLSLLFCLSIGQVLVLLNIFVVMFLLLPRGQIFVTVLLGRQLPESASNQNFIKSSLSLEAFLRNGASFSNLKPFVFSPSVPRRAPDGGESGRPARQPRQLHQDRRGLDRHRVHRDGEDDRSTGRRQEDGPEEAAAPRTALQRGDSKRVVTHKTDLKLRKKLMFRTYM